MSCTTDRKREMIRTFEGLAQIVGRLPCCLLRPRKRRYYHSRRHYRAACWSLALGLKNIKGSDISKIKLTQMIMSNVCMTWMVVWLVSSRFCCMGECSRVNVFCACASGLYIVVSE